MKKLILLLSVVFINGIHAQDIAIAAKGVTLCGTLETPDTNIAVPAVLIIAGSGPTDEDGNSPAFIGKNNSLKYLAEELLKHGIASLRYNKRFIGKCAQTPFDESSLTIDILIDDAVKCVEYLKKDKRFSKVIVIGHSEGSLIGMIAAQKAGTDAFVSIAGAGKPADALIKEQVKNVGASEELRNQFTVILDSLKGGHTVNAIDPSLYGYFRPSVQPYMISWIKYDPAKEIAKLNIPVLIAQGTNDIQMTMENAEILKAANAKAELVKIDNMNHVLKEVIGNDMNKSIQAYGDPNLPVVPKLVKAIAEFIKK
ncbi:MAG TPA: alpha/beta hydrolase [Ignavibacteriales bacterium]|nr:alpha/beta hydrolase [Ignavibacteriales bacterium]